MRQAREYNYRAMAMSLGPPAPVPVKGAQRGKRSCWRKWGASLLRFMVGAASAAEFAMSQKPSVSQNSVPVPNLVSQKPSVAKPVFAPCHCNRFADVTRRAASGSDALAGRGDTGDAFEGEGRRSPLLAGSFDARDAPGP